MERLGVLGGCNRRASHGALDNPDVESDLLLHDTDLALSPPAEPLLRMLDHRVVHAPDESGDADHALEVDLDDIERRRVASMVLPQLELELIDEGRLPGVARAEERDIRL